MSEIIDLKDVLMSFDSVSEAYGFDVLMKNGNGVPKSIPYSKFGLTNLAYLETAGSVMSLRDFTIKYVYGKRVGHILTDAAYSHGNVWRLAISDDILINLQHYAILIVKNHRILSQDWANITMLFIPSSQEAKFVYFVGQNTGATASDYTVAISKMEVTTVGKSESGG